MQVVVAVGGMWLLPLEEGGCCRLWQNVVADGKWLLLQVVEGGCYTNR